MKRALLSKLVLLSAALSGWQCLAQVRCEQLFLSEYLFGYELTITNQSIVNEGNRNPRISGLAGNPLKEKAWRTLAEKIEALCAKTGDCVVSDGKDKYGPAKVVTFRDGNRVVIGLDACVLEITGRPGTPTQHLAFEPLFKKYILDPAAEIGLEPHDRAGGGHIHISRKAFLESSLAYFNFFKDFQNRPALIYGALGNHLGNAPPLSVQTKEQRDGLLQVDKNYRPSDSIDQVSKEIRRLVYHKTYMEDFDPGNPAYYQAANFTRIYKPLDEATLEIRSFAPHRSFKAFVLAAELLQVWVKKHQSLKASIPYLNRTGGDFTPQQQVDEFAQLIRDLGLNFEVYKVILRPHLQNIRPTANPNTVPYSLNDF